MVSATLFVVVYSVVVPNVVAPARRRNPAILPGLTPEASETNRFSLSFGGIPLR